MGLMLQHSEKHLSDGLLCVGKQWIRVNKETSNSNTALPLAIGLPLITLAGAECFTNDNAAARVGAGTKNNIVHIVMDVSKCAYALIIGK